MIRLTGNFIWSTWLFAAALGAVACDVDETDTQEQGVSSASGTDDAATDESDGVSDAGRESDAERSDESVAQGDETDDDVEARTDGQDAGGDDGPRADAGDFVEGEGDETDEAESTGPAPEPRGFIVVHSDYVSSTLSVIGFDGEVLSPLLISSGSAASGISEALSSDIVLSNSVTSGEHAIIIDRGNNVISWLNLESAEVDEQLNVGPGGFAANPQDYVPYAEGKAFVTRYASNADPGQATFDEGGDVLVVDPSEPELVARIDLSDVPDDEALQPRAASAQLVAGRLYVLATMVDVDFTQYGESKLVTIDPEMDEVLDVLSLGGMRNCGELSVNPSANQLAIGCVGDWTGDPLAQTGITLVELDGELPTLGDQYFADDLAGLQVGTVSYSADDTLLWTATGSYDDDFNVVSGDSLRRIDLDAGEAAEEPLLETEAPFSLGGLECVANEHVCLLADAEAGKPQLIQLDADGGVDDIESVTVDDGVGHPPRYIGLW